MVNVDGAGAGDLFKIVEESLVNLFCPLHLVAGSTQDLAYRSILRISVKATAAKKHHFDKKPDGAPIGKSIGLGSSHRGAKYQSELRVAEDLTKPRRKVFAVRQHLFVELLPGGLFERLDLLGTNDHDFSCAQRRMCWKTLRQLYRCRGCRQRDDPP